MKERLHELGIKMTELAGYMKISRPSLYKYVESYEDGDFKSVPEKVLRTFKFIDRFKTLTKENLITYVICEFSDPSESNPKESIRKYLMMRADNDPKIELMFRLVSSDWLDPIIPYISNCINIASKENMSDSERMQIARLALVRKRVSQGEPLSDEELSFLNNE